MTEIERKALALLNEACAEMGLDKVRSLELDMPGERALLRAIEQHEAYRQEVSDAVVKATHTMAAGKLVEASGILASFIITKPDHIRSAALDIGVSWGPNDSDSFRAALAARGLKIVEDK